MSGYNDLDFIKYSLEDDSIFKFVEKLNDNKFLTNIRKVEKINSKMYEYYLNNLHRLEIGTNYDSCRIVESVLLETIDNNDIQAKIIESENIFIGNINCINKDCYKDVINSNKLKGSFSNLFVVASSSIDDLDNVVATYINNQYQDIFKKILKSRVEILEKLLKNNLLKDNVFELICKIASESKILISYVPNLSIKKLELLIVYHLIRVDTPNDNVKNIEFILESKLDDNMKCIFVNDNYKTYLKVMNITKTLNTYLKYTISPKLSNSNLIYFSQLGFNIDNDLAYNILIRLANRDKIVGLSKDFIRVILNKSKYETTKIKVYLKYADIIGVNDDEILNLNIEEFNDVINKNVDSIKYSISRVRLLELMIKNNMIKEINYSQKRPRMIRIKYNKSEL